MTRCWSSHFTTPTSHSSSEGFATPAGHCTSSALKHPPDQGITSGQQSLLLWADDTATLCHSEDFLNDPDPEDQEMSRWAGVR